MKNNKNLEITKALFIWNALQDGWEVKKKNETYVFSKPHENKKKVYTEEYLKEFVQGCMNSNNNLVT